MKKLTIAAALAAVALTTPALADDAATARWTGGYASLSYGQFVEEDDTTDTFYGAGVGWNFALGQSGIIAGIDLKIGQYNYGNTAYDEAYVAAVLGKAFSEEVFAYGFAAYGIDDGESAQQYGVGMDYALTDRISIGAQIFQGSMVDSGYSWVSTLAQVKYAF